MTMPLVIEHHRAGVHAKQHDDSPSDLAYDGVARELAQVLRKATHRQQHGQSTDAEAEHERGTPHGGSRQNREG